MKIKIAILLAATITLTCCKTENNIRIKDDLIKKIAKEDQKYPSQYGSMFLFATCDDNKIARVDVEYLREIYRLAEIKTDFETYLRTVLNQKQKIDFQDVTKKFELDSCIYDQINKTGITEIIDSYCRKLTDDSYALNKDLPKNKTYTVLYLLFINNYMSGLDDYLGEFIIWKI